MLKNRVLNTSCLVFMLTALLAGVLFTHAQALKGGDVPTLKTPYGYIIDTTPSYKWTLATDATNYQLQLYQGATLIYTKTYGNSFCGVTTCVRAPADVLALGKYKWRVRAKIGGLWKVWSGYKYFDLVEPSLSFNSNFNDSMKGWMRKGGGSWHVTTTALYTEGSTDVATSIYRTTGNYTNFTYEASIRRTVNGPQANYLAVRMGNCLDDYKQWYPGYIFGYTNDGKVSIWRYDTESSSTPIVHFEETDDVNPYGWNTVKVVANGSNFKYYINNVLQADFSDATYPSGMVGFQMYTPGAPLGEFEVDWARLQVISTP